MIVSVGAIEHEPRPPEFSELILDGVQGEKTKPRKLTDVEFLSWIGEQQAQNLRPHLGK
jgi:hypothetical protein